MELNLAARMVVAPKLEVLIRGERRLGLLLCGSLCGCLGKTLFLGSPLLYLAEPGFSCHMQSIQGPPGWCG